VGGLLRTISGKTIQATALLSVLGLSGLWKEQNFDIRRKLRWPKQEVIRRSGFARK
jgi:hypothetical protein